MVELGAHQIKALTRLNRGRILAGGVGSGKSRTAIAWYYGPVCGGKHPVNGVGDWAGMETPLNLVIITTAKKRDSKEWDDELRPFRLVCGTQEDTGATILVDSWNNIRKYEEVRGSVFIFDEQRLVGSGAWVKSFQKIASRNQWILLSATPGDTWLDYIPVFVANGFYKNPTDFKRQHVIYKHFANFPQVDRYVGTKKLDRLRDSLLVEMPVVRHTSRHERLVRCVYDRYLFKTVWTKRWNPFVDEPIKDVGELFRVARRVVNSDPSRLESLVGLLAEHPRVIVFYNFDYELAILRELGAVDGLVVAEWNGHKHEPVPSSDRWVYLVQYTAGSEGWNCVTTDTIVFFSLNYSYKVLEQSMGRIDRLNTPYRDLYYYHFRSTSPVDLAINKALSRKKTFHERSFKW